MKFLLPFDRFTIKVWSEPEESKKHLLDFVEVRTLDELDTASSYLQVTTKPFTGIVNECGFQITPTIAKGNSFSERLFSIGDPAKGTKRIVEARGKFYKDTDGTIVKVMLMPNPATLIGLSILWVILMFFFSGLGVVQSLIIATILIGIPYIIFVIMFWVHTPSVKAKLLELIEQL